MGNASTEVKDLFASANRASSLTLSEADPTDWATERFCEATVDTFDKEISRKETTRSSAARTLEVILWSWLKLSLN